MIVRLHGFFWFLLATACCFGCGSKAVKKSANLDLVPVSGTITLDGKPLPEATLSFLYQGAPPEGFIGSGAVSDAQGHYEVSTLGQKGTVPGTYKVTVSKLVNATGLPIKPEEGMDMEQLRAAGGVKESVPPKYADGGSTDLTTTVEKGKPDGYNLELKGS